jgi:hypothetical protein
LGGSPVAEDLMVDAVGIAKLAIEAVKLLDGKFTNRDVAEYKRLLRALTDFRLLTSRYNAEYAGPVIESAQRLRSLLNSNVQTLPENSGLERGFLALGQVARQFISQVDALEADIRHNLDLIVINSEQGIEPDGSSKRFLQHWQRVGYPDRVLRGNHKLNVTDIWYEGYRMIFLLSLGELRGQFGFVLSQMCEIMSIELPQELASLTPGIAELTDAA